MSSNEGAIQKPACDKENVSLHGSRIVNLEKLQEYINKPAIHATQCGGEILMSGERRNGLAVTISTHCSKCSYTIPLETSHKVKDPRGYRRRECNLAAVWGQMSTGVGHSKLSEIMSVIGVQVMSARHFINTEQDIGEWWRNELQELMVKYCSACTHGVPVDQHVCYKNWDKSSSEMEPDIILEGFKQAEKVHGV